MVKNWSLVSVQKTWIQKLLSLKHSQNQSWMQPSLYLSYFGSKLHLYCQVGDNEFIAKVDARDYFELVKPSKLLDLTGRTKLTLRQRNWKTILLIYWTVGRDWDDMSQAPFLKETKHGKRLVEGEGRLTDPNFKDSNADGVGDLKDHKTRLLKILGLISSGYRLFTRVLFIDQAMIFLTIMPLILFLELWKVWRS